MSDQDAVERKEAQGEPDTLKQSPNTCNRAFHEGDKSRTNVFEEVSAADDAHQVVISTNGDLVSARQVTAGGRAKQWLGQMNDESLQRLSKTQGIDVADCATTKDAVGPESEPGVNFDQYGAGYMLDGGGTQ